MTQKIAALLTLDADAPPLDHGETADKPIPTPNASRISDNAAAANAPAITAPQETPDAYASDASPIWWTDLACRGLAIG